MRGQSVPDQQQRPAAELAAEVGEEVDELHFVETVAHDAEVHSTSTPVPAIGQDRADGELLPVERMSEHRCSSTRSPGPPDRGPLRNAAFIEENYPCTPGLRFFLLPPTSGTSIVRPSARRALAPANWVVAGSSPCAEGS